MTNMMLQNVFLSNEYYMIQRFGGRNPKNGVNHVHLCLLKHLLHHYLRLCFMYFFLHCDIVSYRFFFFCDIKIYIGIE